MSARFTSSTRRSSLRRSRALLAATAAVAAVGAAGATAGTAAAGPVTPVPSLDLQKYLGEWRQIAALPQWYEALCVSDTAANYSLNDDGTVRVSNRCVGPLRTNVATRGRARVIDKTTNAALQVTFAGIANQWFYPDAKPNYVVIALGASYDLSVVADPERTSAFVLARTPTLTAAQKATALAALRNAGFDPCKLRVTVQSGGASKTGSFCSL